MLEHALRVTHSKMLHWLSCCCLLRAVPKLHVLEQSISAAVVKPSESSNPAEPVGSWCRCYQKVLHSHTGWRSEAVLTFISLHMRCHTTKGNESMTQQLSCVINTQADNRLLHTWQAITAGARNEAKGMCRLVTPSKNGHMCIS
jgi:hypothetical protein